MAPHVRERKDLGELMSVTRSEPQESGPLDAAAAVARYMEIAPRLPTAKMPSTSLRRAHLGELLDEFDCFVLDGFGVLNVGASAVPGAAERVEELRRAGCQVRVLTNGATFPSTTTAAKYAAWGIDFELAHVVSSRDALAKALADALSDRLSEGRSDGRSDGLADGSQGVSDGKGPMTWGFAALETSEIQRLSPDAVLLGNDDELYDAVDGFVLLGAGSWTDEHQARLLRSLDKKCRPVLVGNPDLVAPHEAGLSREPGLYAHALEDAGVCTPVFYGKPFGNAFELVAETLDGIDPRRIAMVGDSLHTDILGGAAAGWRTVLVLDHGLMRTLDVESAIGASGIRPDFIVSTT